MDVLRAAIDQERAPVAIDLEEVNLVDRAQRSTNSSGDVDAR